MRQLPDDFVLLQVVPALDTGGVEQTTLDVARAVTARGGRALVASEGGRLEEALKAAGGELIRLPMASKNPLTAVANTGRLIEIVRREKVSLIHVRSRAPAFAALGAARRTGVPMVATYHGVYNARGAIKRWYNAVMTRGELVIANSEFTRAHVLAEHGTAPERVVAVPRGVDLSRFSPEAVAPERVEALRQAWGLDPADTRPVILLAGRMTRWKGQLLLIEALRRADEAGVQARAVLAGDDQGRSDYSAEVRAAIAEAGLTERVVIAGHVGDMPAAYLACDLAAAPSLDPEAFGRTAVEPQAMGRPVLAAAHGATTETVVHGETGWLVAPGDPDAWAEAIVTAVQAGPERRAAMGRAGRARVEALYSVERMTASTLDLYARVLEARR